MVEWNLGVDILGQGPLGIRIQRGCLLDKLPLQGGNLVGFLLELGPSCSHLLLQLAKEPLAGTGLPDHGRVVEHGHLSVRTLTQSS
jgi:hypothetical protein